MTGSLRAGLRQRDLRAILARAGLLLSAHLLLFAGGLPALPSAGVVVENVGPRQAGERAGLLPQDVLLAWQRAGGAPRRSISSPFGFAELEAEESLRGRVSVFLRRGGEDLVLPLGPGKWGITVRPRLSDAAGENFQKARDLLKARQTEEGVRLLSEAAEEARKAGDPHGACWLRLEAAKAWAAAGNRERARETLEAATEEGKRLSSEVWAQVLEAKGEALARQNDLPAAKAAYREAAKLRERRSARSLALAVNLDHLLRLALYRGDIAGAERLGRRALAIRQTAAPGTFAVAESWNSLGSVAMSAEDTERAEGFHRKGLELAARILPGSLEHARSANNLGLAVFHRGNLVEAERLYRLALEVFEKADPQDRRTATTVNALANLYRARGDFDSAEELHRRVLAIYEKLTPGGGGVALAFNSLGNDAHVRGDLSAATEHYRKALAIWEKLAPESLDVAHALSNLAETALDRGDLAEAESFARRSLKIRERKAPGSLPLAQSFQDLGDIASRRREADAALSWYRRALTIREKLAPGSAKEAEGLYGVGRSLREKRDLVAAASHFGRALDALDLARGRAGGSEDARSGFQARFAPLYHDAIQTALERNRPDEAFHILERSRARALLAMLAERDLRLERDVPPALARKLRDTNSEYDRTQGRLAGLDLVREQPLAEDLHRKLRALARRRADSNEEIRAVSPRLADLQAPRPLTRLEVERTLDRGTALLSYSVGREKTILLTLREGRAGLSAYVLPVGEDDLRKETQLFRSLVLSGRDGSAPSDALIRQGEHVFRLLVEPAWQTVAGARRVVICPDGPLHSLPFAALIPPTERAGNRPVYLVERIPVHVTLSATLYGELRRGRARETARDASWKVALFGDPLYPGAGKAAARGPESSDSPPEAERGGSFSSPAARALTLEPLPSSRQEVDAIASLYPRRSLAYTGKLATESRVKSLGRTARYVHFACHSLMDRRFPLDSALALSMPSPSGAGADNGLLQAWEIFESVRLEADLVTLSACESGLGEELGGEGLQSLARAFQFAGARSVLASLWTVADVTTAGLMEAFYGGLKKGLTKDAALRQAQIALLTRPVSLPVGRRADASHPYFWAGFQLIGDWR